MRRENIHSADLGEVVSLGKVAVLVGLPGDGVGDALPLVAVAPLPHVVTRLRLVARVGHAVLDGLNTVRSLVSV